MESVRLGLIGMGLIGAAHERGRWIRSAGQMLVSSHPEGAMLRRFNDGLRRCTEIVIMALMAFLVVIVVASVIFRYLLLSPISWSEEVGRYVMIWVGFLAASIAAREGLHVGVDFLVQWVPPAVARWLRRLARLAVIGFLLVVTSYGFILVTNLWDQYSPVLDIRMTWPYLAIPVGSLLMLVQLVTPMGQENDAETAR